MKYVVFATAAALSLAIAGPAFAKRTHAEQQVRLAAGFGLAQTTVLARAGNIWGGLNHEPVPSEILPRERAAGVDSPARQGGQDDEVERLYRDLMQSEGRRALPRPHSSME